MDTGPFFLPDGRIGFTSNRNSNGLIFQLFSMDRSGKGLELFGHRAMANQLHPIILKDGRVAYTSDDVMLQKVGNNQFCLFTINPDGSNPFIFAGKNDASAFSYHYLTQLSDGDIIATLYYNHNNNGLGSLLRFPVDPPGPDFQHLWRPLDNTTPMSPLADGAWYPGTKFIPFGRPDQFLLTPQASAGDNHNGPYESPSDYWIHPFDGREVYMEGKYTHPAAAPDNDLLVSYCIGGCSQQPHPDFTKSLDATMRIIGKDNGIWLLPLEANGTRRIGHITDDGLIVVDLPQYHEIMPRAVVSYERIYGMAAPVDPEPTPNTGNQDQRLAAGEPFALSGASSLYDRETRALNGTPWNMSDSGGTMSGRTYLNLAASGAELAIFDNSEVAGIRVVMPIPDYAKYMYGNTEQWAGKQRHHLRILGEFPVRKPDANGQEPVDEQGNPDTSFIVKIPADTPFLFQTIDKRGMALDIETTSRSVHRGEQQLCIGCHVHTRDGMDPFSSVAKLDISAPFGDFSGTSAPLLSDVDVNGFAIAERAVDIYSESLVPGVGARRSFAVDWRNGISAIIERRCASCHGRGQPAQQETGLRLDGDDRTYELITKNRYTDEDGSKIDASTSSNDRITPRAQCCTVSRWISMNSARSSMLVWALYGERLDGRNPDTGLPWGAMGESIPADVKQGLLNVPVDDKGSEKPETWAKVAEHAAYVADMPKEEKRLIARWIDIGAPKLNVHEDLMRPVMTITPVLQGDTVSTVQLGLWDDSPIDYSRLKVTANGVDITPSVQGSPAVVTVNLGEASVTDVNADSLRFTFEVWDKPDRSLDKSSPGVAAANRRYKEYSGRDILRMVNVSPNAAPSSASASITTVVNRTSGGVLASVVDADEADTHIISIASQPNNGFAEVINNRLVYTPNTDFIGSDSFTFRAEDLGGGFVIGTANVTVSPNSSDGGSGGTGNGSGTDTDSGGLATKGGGALGPLFGLVLLVMGCVRRRYFPGNRSLQDNLSEDFSLS